MRRIGFDNDRYIEMQSGKIRERIEKFGGKLYLEFGGKLFDDYHARVLPGFRPDSKLNMLLARAGGNHHRHQRLRHREKTRCAVTSALPTTSTCCA